MRWSSSPAEHLPAIVLCTETLLIHVSTHLLSCPFSLNGAGDSKSGLPPIIGAVLGNSSRSSKLSHGLSSTSDHKNASRFHEPKKAVKRKSKGRLFETSTHRYQGQGELQRSIVWRFVVAIVRPLTPVIVNVIYSQVSPQANQCWSHQEPKCVNPPPFMWASSSIPDEPKPNGRPSEMSKASV